jgi:hypothetical protein
MPDGALPELLLFAPELIVPNETTVTVLPLPDTIEVAWFPALIPVLPELIVEPNAVLTLALPLP